MLRVTINCNVVSDCFLTTNIPCISSRSHQCGFFKVLPGCTIVNCTILTNCTVQVSTTYKNDNRWHGANIAACLSVTRSLIVPHTANTLRVFLPVVPAFLSWEIRQCVPSLDATAHGLNLLLDILCCLLIDFKQKVPVFPGCHLVS